MLRGRRRWVFPLDNLRRLHRARFGVGTDAVETVTGHE
jgi:hypothetical protein